MKINSAKDFLEMTQDQRNKLWKETARLASEEQLRIIGKANTPA